MGFFNKYPYEDFHELNLDWILKTIKGLRSDMDTFEVINKLKYEGIWDITKQYPIWSIVSVDNIGYLSLQNVPTGINILDSEYWLPIFDLNLQTQGSNDTIIISDSYGVPSVVGNNSWVTQLQTLLETKLGATVYTSRHGSRGFVPFNIVDECFLDSLKEFDNLSYTNKQLIKNIIVCGGANDANQTVSTIDTNIAAFCSYAKTNYPNATVYIGMISYSDNPYNIARYSIPAYQNCLEHGALYLNGVENALRLNNLQADGVHPTSAGNDEIAKAVISSFFTGNYSITRFTDSITFTPSGICTAVGSLGTVSEHMTDGISRVMLRSYDGGHNMKFTVTKDTWNDFNVVEIGTLSGNLCASGRVAHGFGFHTHGYFRSGAPINGTNMMFELWLGTGNKVYLSALGLGTSGSFWGDAITGVDSIQLNDVCLRDGNSYIVL